jgi:hypothetical protein
LLGHYDEILGFAEYTLFRITTCQFPNHALPVAGVSNLPLHASNV